MQDFGKGNMEMQVHHQGTLGRRGNHIQPPISMDSPPQRTTASGTLSGILLRNFRRYYILIYNSNDFQIYIFKEFF